MYCFLIGAEQSNEEAGEHFTPREVIQLMVILLLTPEKDLGQSHVVKTIYDPACGTGGMLSVTEQFLLDNNQEAKPIAYGQDWNDEAWAVCCSDMLIKGQTSENINLGCSFTQDGFSEEYFKREVLPHVPDAWIDHSKTKVGYEIPFNRHFYRYELPRPLEEIEAEIKELEGEIITLLREVGKTLD